MESGRKVRSSGQWIMETQQQLSSRWIGIRSRIAIDGSLKSMSGKNAASGWSVVQLDYEGDHEPRYAIYGTMMA